MTHKNSLPILVLLLTIGAATASAQTTCTVTSITQTLRGGGLTEMVGDILLTCSGGTPTAEGSPVPTTSITLQIQGAMGVTNRVFATDPTNGDFTDALAIIDSPADNAQLVCVEPCPVLGTGDGQVYDGSAGHPNVFQAHLQIDPSVIVWYGVPIDGGSHTIRLTNVRVAVPQVSITTPVSVDATVSTAPTNILASGTGALTVGMVYNALLVIPLPQNSLPVVFQSCVGQNPALVANPAALGTSQLTIELREQTVTDAFRPRTGTPFVDDNTSPAPTTGGEESGTVNLSLPVITGQGDLSQAGLADSGTRLYATFSGVPAGVHLFAPVVVPLPQEYGPSGVIRMVAPSLLNGGAFQPVTGASNGLAEFTSPSGGAATVVYEVLSSADALIDTADIPIYVAYAPSDSVVSVLGPAQFSAGFGPVSTVSVSTATDPIPRFSASNTLYDAFLIAACAPSLTISVSHPGTFAQGQIGAQYTLAVSNQAGVGPTAGTVTVTDSLPSSLPAPLTATAIAGTGWACSLSGLSCTRSDSLSPGASYPAITVTANVSSSAPSQVINAATVTGGGSPMSACSDPTTITADAVAISGLRPASVAPGAAAFTLTVKGTGFLSGAQVTWNGTALSTSFVSATQLVALVPADLISAAGTATVTVVNPGDDTSGGVDFPIQSGPGLAFFPISPCRLVDTRVGQGKAGAFGPPELTAFSSRDFPLLSAGCSIPSTAQAYSLNFTVVPSGPLGFLSAWPTGDPYPGVSTLNSSDGSVIANAAIVPAGSSGSITVMAANPTDLVIDINGYFAPADASGLDFFPLRPCRMADTRTSQPFAGAFGPPSLSAWVTRDFPLAASPCLSASGQAYSLNMTVVPQGPLGFLSTWPVGLSYPGVSTLNSPDGIALANAALVPAGSNGGIDVLASNNTDLIIDLNGMFAAPGTGGLQFYAVRPCRVADTRSSQPFTDAFGPPSLAAYSKRDFPIALSPCGIPSTAQAYALNLTVVPQGPLSYLSTWPAGQSYPGVSTLNSPNGGVVANAAIVPAGGEGAITVLAANPTDLIIDAVGYFAP